MVVGLNGELIEVQIWIWDMYCIVEFGIVVYWVYKEGVVIGNNFEDKIMFFWEIFEF